ncbi:hypothetical protein BD324DRAFT_616991 [Kockovaella imperatae]|uniref:Uncharacterized protein n=1 Tax=Kockovaella imperatae TaxID=4999 RepID=A0A1Y1UQ97_9TREE|nr:hypothetical protein BD324DRAFT_616991 [Kockovaella imperatae]ORX40238.1 hypothetical protein BD324DRAFT_616991 [Kockovaella imperatae]
MSAEVEDAMDDLQEQLEKQMEKEDDPVNMDDVEATIELWQQRYNKLVEDKYRQLTKQLRAGAGMLLNFAKKFTFTIPKVSAHPDKAAYLAAIEDRIVKVTYNNGRGYHQDLKLIKRRVTDFSERFLADKSLDQLAAIHGIPAAHVTPLYLERCGLANRKPSNERAVIYIKLIEGSREQLTKLRNSVREDNRKFTTRFFDFLHEPLEPWMEALQFPEKNPDTPFLYHIGRYSSGKLRRMHWEQVGCKEYDASRGERPWVEAVVHGGGSRKIIYYVLSCHDDKYGIEWSDSMMFDEMLWSAVFIGPGLTNVAWPGTDGPAPPATLGGELPAGPFDKAHRDSTDGFWQSLTRQRAKDKHGIEIDAVTATCLMALRWKPAVNPITFVRTFKSNRIRISIILGLDQPFQLQVTHRNIPKRSPIYMTLYRLMVCYVDERLLCLRPAGLTLDDKQVPRSPVDLHFDTTISDVGYATRFTRSPTPPDALSVLIKRARPSNHHPDTDIRWNLVFADDPSHHVMFSQTVTTAHYLSFKLQKEASMILCGDKPEPMSMGQLEAISLIPVPKRTTAREEPHASASTDTIDKEETPPELADQFFEIDKRTNDIKKTVEDRMGARLPAPLLTVDDVEAEAKVYIDLTMEEIRWRKKRYELENQYRDRYIIPDRDYV